MSLTSYIFCKGIADDMWYYTSNTHCCCNGNIGAIYEALEILHATETGEGNWKEEQDRLWQITLVTMAS